MEEFEKYLTIDAVAERSGISSEAIRNFCHRGPKHHPLPHVKVGNTQRHIRIRWSTFTEWCKEEERLSVA